MKPLYALGLALLVSACGSDPIPQLRTNLAHSFTLEGSYKINPCGFNYPSEIVLTDTQATLNYATQGETRTFQSKPEYYTVDGNYGLVAIELKHPTGYCGVDYDSTCINPYTRLVVFASFDESTGILGFGNCTYRHD